MGRKLFPALLVICALLVVQGCSVNRATATLAPGADLTRIRDVYVVKEAGDDHNIDELIKMQLTKSSYTATNGPELPLPYKADAVLTYVDKWMWDITMYMLELTVHVRDPETNTSLAVGNSFHTSLSRKSPEAMVEEVLNNIFKNPKSAGTSQ
ncbi:MAG: hypothetical protein E4G97_05975 [Deltaproteobacteria bacterium]|nr:MAG: hypothetical protein E4G97_05975 [Deltaproteobacteria bacterium]